MTALATPFRNGAFDREAYERLIEHQLKSGISALVPMGTTGESVTMKPSEREEAIASCVQANQGRALVIAGAGSNSTHECIEAVKRVRSLGADAALLVTPYYNKPTQAGLVEHYRAVAKENPGFPLVAYNVPGRTGVDLLPETAARLCEISEVVALKEATGNLVRALEIKERCGDRLILLSGDDFTVQPFMACGGRGVISVSSNVAPKEMSDLVAQALLGQFDSALKIQLQLQTLHRLLFIESSPIPVKWALHVMGYFSPELRLPLTPLSETHRASLSAELKRLNLM